MPWLIRPEAPSDVPVASRRLGEKFEEDISAKLSHGCGILGDSKPMNTKAGLMVQVASSFTSTPIERSLESAIIQAGVGEGVRFCQYEQMSQYMLGSGADSPEILGTIVLLRVEDWLRDDLKSAPSPDGTTPGSHEQLHFQLRNRVNEFVNQIATLARRGKQVWFMACPSRGWFSERHNIGTLCQTYTSLVVARVRNDRQITTLRWPSTSFSGEVEDNRADRLGRIPFTQQTYDQLGQFLGSQIVRTAQRRELCAVPATPLASADLADYLAGLKIHVQVARADHNDRAKLDRILRMAADFSLHGEKRDLSEDEIDRLLASGWCMRIVVSDRLADYGISGILACRPTADALIVEAMSLSCTVLGKQVEYAVFSALTEIASDLRVARILFEFSATERNQPTHRFLQSVADRVSDTRFVVPLELAEARLRSAAVSPGAWTVELERSVAGSIAR